MEKAVIIQKPFLYPTKRPFLMSNEMEELAKHFKSLEEGQEKIHSHLRMTEASINELKGAVIGNPPMGMRGLAERMEDLEERMTEFDKKGVLEKASKVIELEARMHKYDQMYDRWIGASKVVTFLWVLLGTILGFVLPILIKKFM